MKTDERCKGLKLLQTVNFKLFFIFKLYFFYLSNFYCCGNLCTHSDNMEMLTFTKPFSITKLLYRDGVLRFWSWIYCIFLALADGPSFYMPVSHSTRAHKDEQPAG